MFIARVGDTTGRLSHFYNFPSQQHHQQYWVTRQDVAQETEKWAEWAKLANAADSAHFFYFPLQSPSSPVSLRF